MLRKLVDSPWTYFALASVLVILAILSQIQTVGEDAPEGTVADLESLSDRDDLNVIFILIDTLRADRLGAYGYERNTSPNLDALAARGIRFASAESQSSWTKASMASLWASRYPERTGVTRSDDAISQEALLPAEILNEAGYQTAGIWRNGWVANNFGFGQGFDLYYKPTPNRNPGARRGRSPSEFQLGGSDLDITESALEFMTNHKNDRFFLYLHYMDVHQYVSSDQSPSWGTSFSDNYDRSIFWTDQNIGLLMEKLFELELLSHTMIVIASDHGEGFFEHGGEGHARSLYKEVQHVPLIIVPPIRLAEGVVVEESVANIDIWPTVLDMMGLPPVPDAEGRSLLPLILEGSKEGVDAEALRNRSLFAQLDKNWGKRTKGPDPLISMVDGSYRYIFLESVPEATEVYDRSTDPLEKKNIVRDNSVPIAELQAKVKNFLDAGSPVWGDAPRVDVDEMMQAQLRALGYAFTMTNPEEVQRRKKAAEEVQQNQKWD